MQTFFNYTYLFVIGSMMGWCIELVYRRYFSSYKKWINPGFLNGPWLPIYGFGICILYTISDLEINIGYKILCFAVTMTAIEYVVGIIFIKGMKLKLWDYSHEWLNLQGIICPKYTIFWTALGVFFYYCMYPYLHYFLVWTNDNSFMLFIFGIWYGAFFVDFGMSIGIGIKIRSVVSDMKIALNFERLKAKIRSDARAEKRKNSFFFAIKSEKPLRETIKELFAVKKNKTVKDELSLKESVNVEKKIAVNVKDAIEQETDHSVRRKDD